MPSLGVNGATPFAQRTNHPTALNHSHRDVSSYDAKRQIKVKCTYCGCWATKGELCYQCKQPTGPLVLPRRNGYRVEPLVGCASARNNTANNSRSQSEGGMGVYLSPRQRERVNNLITKSHHHADGDVSFTANNTNGSERSGEGADEEEGYTVAASRYASDDESRHHQHNTSHQTVVINRTSSARPQTSVYDRINFPRRLSSIPSSAETTPRRSKASEHSPSRSSPSSSYVGGRPAKRYYVQTGGVRAAEQLITHLKEHVVAAREEALRDAERRFKRQSRSNGGGGIGGDLAAAGEGDEDYDEDGDMYGYYKKIQREKAAARRVTADKERDADDYNHVPLHESPSKRASVLLRSDSSSPSSLRRNNSGIRDWHKGVTGGYFYHNDHTALGHKFREETPYDPTLQTKIKCRYCGCWAKKNAPCVLCKTVNRG